MSVVSEGGVNMSARFETITALAVLDTSSYYFYLTGSRYFGWSGPSSDWDFFTTNTPEVKGFLKSNNFQMLDDCLTEYPEDLSIVSVYQRGNVQVQLVRSAEVKAKAQRILFDSPMRNDMEGKKGSTVRPYWKWAIKMAEEILGVPF